VGSIGDANRSCGVYSYCAIVKFYVHTKRFACIAPHIHPGFLVVGVKVFREGNKSAYRIVGSGKGLLQVYGVFSIVAGRAGKYPAGACKCIACLAE
jgi:hypothetical protein